MQEIGLMLLSFVGGLAQFTNVTDRQQTDRQTTRRNSKLTSLSLRGQKSKLIWDSRPRVGYRPLRGYSYTVVGGPFS